MTVPITEYLPLTLSTTTPNREFYLYVIFGTGISSSILK